MGKDGTSCAVALPFDGKDRLASAAMQDLRQARDLFLGSDEVASTVRPVVLRSWKRCRAYGVDPERMSAQSPDPQKLARARAENERLLSAADALIASAHEMLHSHAHLIALSDRDGYILRLVCDPRTQQVADAAASLFEGASWHEKDIGCNGIGTSLAEGNAVILIGPEHYQQCYLTWTCIGVPIRMPDGSIGGALDLSVPNEHVHIHTWGWILSLVQAIEARLAGQLPSLDTAAALREVEDPFNAVRGVFDLITGQLNTSQTHKRFIDEARAQMEHAAQRLWATFRQLLAVQEQLREEDRRKDDFIAVISHELRNPLNAITLAAHILQSEADDPAAVRESAASIGAQGAFMTRLIEDLLDLSRLKQGKFHLSTRRTDLRSIVEQAVDSCRQMMAARGHELCVDLPDQPLWLEADPDRLRQVLCNLLNNAAKYTERQGRIWLGAGREADALLVRVRDTGIGLTADVLPHLFNFYTQAENGRGRSSGGLGIGLALVKALVEMHRGTVSAHSEGAGQGSEFIVRLPTA